MLFGKWRGMPVALALATTLGLGLGLTSLARADGLLLQHTIPREVDAYDFTTGGPFMAPPVPYGHYAKDYVADAHKAAGCITCRLHGLFGGPGAGHGLLHKGGNDDGGFGHGGGAVVDDGSGAGHGGGHGLFGHHATSAYDGYGNTGGIGSGHLGHLHGGTGAGSAGFATTWAEASGQVGAQSSAQSICGQAGCKVASKHSHLSNLLNKIHCGSCGGSGCGACGGTGHGHGGGTGCGLCGGRGCASCLGGLKAGLQGKLASLTGVFHRPKISYFLGAGGPVPITPGYVPYIVSTRSPRDFFSFPPMNPNDP
jgi:hypothetical protein